MRDQYRSGFTEQIDLNADPEWITQMGNNGGASVLAAAATSNHSDSVIGAGTALA